MRVAEFELVEQCLAETLGAVRAEYVEKVIEAAKVSDSAVVAGQAMRIVVLDDVMGTIAARAAETITGGTA